MGYFILIIIGFVLMFLIIEHKLSRMIAQNEEIIELLSKGQTKSEDAE